MLGTHGVVTPVEGRVIKVVRLTGLAPESVGGMAVIFTSLKVSDKFFKAALVNAGAAADALLAEVTVAVMVQPVGS